MTMIIEPKRKMSAGEQAAWAQRKADQIAWRQARYAAILQAEADERHLRETEAAHARLERQRIAAIALATRTAKQQRGKLNRAARGQAQSKAKK